MHEKIEKDGMTVLVVSEMNKRFDAEGVELPTRDMKGSEIVHASEIARYYDIDLQDVGFGDNRVMGVWSLVFGNHMGQRVPYNSEATAQSDVNRREWRPIKDSRGQTIENKEKVVNHKVIIETDDGMYANYADVLRFAKANGWTKGGGRPVKGAAPAIDINTIVAAVVAAMRAAEPERKKVGPHA